MQLMFCALFEQKTVSFILLLKQIGLINSVVRAIFAKLLFVKNVKMQNSIEIVHPCTDFGFKKAMRCKEVTIGFLNTILCLPEEDKITEVTYLSEKSNETLESNFTVDILCETTKNSCILIEMKNDSRVDYSTKAFVELCRLIAYWDSETINQNISELERKRKHAGATHKLTKEFWKNIKTVIVLVVTNKKMALTRNPEIINTYRMTHEKYTEQYLGQIDARVIMVMLCNFTKNKRV
jgi:hypothetical protein